LAAVTLPFMAAYYARFGLFATTDLSAPGYGSACRALACIRREWPIPFVPVSRATRLHAYAVSPSFRELEPYLEGELGEWYASLGGVYYDLPAGEIAGGW